MSSPGFVVDGRSHTPDRSGTLVRSRLIVASILVLLAACDQAVLPTGGRKAAISPTIADQTTSDYVDSLAGDEAFEVQTAHITVTRATDPAVRAYASLMAKDYEASKAELDLALSKSGRSPAKPAALPDALQSMLDELDQGAGRDFDKTYIDQQIEAQEAALRLTSAYAETGQVPAIKAAASRFAPTIQAHLDRARAIEDTLNKTL
jgi:putative membrane protein